MPCELIRRQSEETAQRIWLSCEATTGGLPMIDRDNGKGRFEHEHRLAEHEHEHDWWGNNGRGIPAMDHGKCSGRQSPSPGVESQTRIRRGTRHAIRGRGSWTYALSCLAVQLAFCQLPPPMRATMLCGITRLPWTRAVRADVSVVGVP
jgi:hypothetical protein